MSVVFVPLLHFDVKAPWFNKWLEVLGHLIEVGGVEFETCSEVQECFSAMILGHNFRLLKLIEWVKQLLVFFSVWSSSLSFIIVWLHSNMKVILKEFDESSWICFVVANVVGQVGITKLKFEFFNR